ncbi:hypothetical protein SARC_00965 [Sphaeroforma arctica JP610]|uniref:Chromo domain-containing protein n=1 Tax=Sphaeroforma arctica JP610 TaxID=667725 RepID=A0A0L0GD28_9EUKA|nr:hypothetical protein SARC_00965 [Sphaeroforma arctica JP610]KNC86920.1 hypothetical protein SARC_00965 [Sphaeroforma arctica JP610]|eukprot:XP_014160822.1 hypothetical protein SARC_00965 [Sphaeroforma arctica JP610]
MKDTILPTLHHIAKKYPGRLTKTFDRPHSHDLVHFDEGDVVIVRSEGRTTKAICLLFGPYATKTRIGQRYQIANKDGSAPSDLKSKPVRVELIRLVHRITDPPLDDTSGDEGGTGKLEYLVRWREGDPTWETVEAFSDPNDIVA